MPLATTSRPGATRAAPATRHARPRRRPAVPARPSAGAGRARAGRRAPATVPDRRPGRAPAQRCRRPSRGAGPADGGAAGYPLPQGRDLAGLSARADGPRLGAAPARARRRRVPTATARRPRRAAQRQAPARSPRAAREADRPARRAGGRTQVRPVVMGVSGRGRRPGRRRALSRTECWTTGVQPAKQPDRAQGLPGPAPEVEVVLLVDDQAGVVELEQRADVVDDLAGRSGRRCTARPSAPCRCRRRPRAPTSSTVMSAGPADQHPPHVLRLAVAQPDEHRVGERRARRVAGRPSPRRRGASIAA